MPRKPRFDAPGAIQHVVARGIAGGRIFLDDDDRRWFLGKLASTSDSAEWLVHAYCLMDTHFHLVIETPEPTLSAGMRRVLGSHAYEFNRRHGRYGHLFAGRYGATLIDSDAHAIEACAYIVLNPLRAGLVDNPADWSWSSYRASAGLVRTPVFLTTRLLPTLLHPNESRARELYQDLVREVAERPRPGSG